MTQLSGTEKAPANTPAKFVNGDGTVNVSALVDAYLALQNRMAKTRDPSLFAITDEFIIPQDWCIKELDRGFTVEMLEKEASKFIRYWTVKGNRKTVLGWHKAWINWLNRSVG